MPGRRQVLEAVLTAIDYCIVIVIVLYYCYCYCYCILYCMKSIIKWRRNALRAIPSMPGIFHRTVDLTVKECKELFFTGGKNGEYLHEKFQFKDNLGTETLESTWFDAKNHQRN